MNSDNRWTAALAARVMGNALAGGVLVGIVGAISLRAAGYVLARLFIVLYQPFSGQNLIDATLLTSTGAGLFGGGLAGAIIFGIAAFKAAPGRFSEPLRAIIGRVVLGQIVGTVGALSFFFAVGLAMFRFPTLRQSLIDYGDWEWIQYGAPILMICGAIAGALSKRAPAQSATLRTE